MTPAEYLNTVVKPLHADFLIEKHKFHRLFAAVVSTYHIVDYLREAAGLPPKQDSDKEVRAVLQRREQHFLALYAVCVAQKHVRIVNKKLTSDGICTLVGDIQGGSSPVTFNGEPVTFNSEPLTMGIGYSVRIKGEVVDLEDALRSVINCLDQHLPAIEAELCQPLAPSPQ